MLSFFTITSPWDTATIAFAYRIDADAMMITGGEAAAEAESKNVNSHHHHFSEGFRDCNPRLPQMEDFGAGQKMLKLLQVRRPILGSCRPLRAYLPESHERYCVHP